LPGNQRNNSTFVDENNTITKLHRISVSQHRLHFTSEYRNIIKISVLTVSTLYGRPRVSVIVVWQERNALVCAYNWDIRSYCIN